MNPNPVPINETAACAHIGDFISRPQIISREVLISLDNILEGVDRGLFEAGQNDLEFFQSLLLLYGSHFEFATLLQNRHAQRPGYARKLAASLVNLGLEYGRVFGTLSPDENRLETDIDEEDFNPEGIIEEAQYHFNEFKKSVLKSGSNGFGMTLEAVGALDSIAAIYQKRAGKNENLRDACQFFESISKLARYQLELRSLLGDIKRLDWSDKADKYQFSGKILHCFLDTGSLYHTL